MNLLDCQGLSLIETIISIIILFITIMGFMTTYSSLSRYAVVMRHKRKALRLVQKSMEECITDPDIMVTKPLTDIIIDERRKVQGALKRENLDPNNKLWYKIRCTITWEDEIWMDGNVSLITLWGKKM